MTQSFLPPPPPAFAQAPQALGFAPPPQQSFAPPPQAQSAPAFAPPQAPPAPAYAPPQAQPAPTPQGFAPAPAFPTSSLNGVNVTDGETLFPQIPGNYDLQLIGFSKKIGVLAGPSYWPRFRVLSSSSPEVPVGSEFSVLCKIAQSPTKNSGDRKRKSVLAACYRQEPNAQIDWDTLSAQTETLNLEQQPLYCHLRQARSSRPMLDKVTKQPNGQFWCDEVWLPAKGA